jgi:cystathionine gamma-synthase
VKGLSTEAGAFMGHNRFQSRSEGKIISATTKKGRATLNAKPANTRSSDNRYINNSDEPRAAGRRSLTGRADISLPPSIVTESIGLPIDYGTFHCFESTDSLAQYQAGVTAGTLPVHLEYARYGNNTVAAVEHALCDLEVGRNDILRSTIEGFLVSDGMRAVSVVLTTLAERAVAAGHSSCVVTAECYKKSRILFDRLARVYGLSVVAVDHADLPEVSLEGVGFVFVETPSNPYLRIADVAAIARRTRAALVPFVVDASFASPINLRPLTLGADIVVHSVTKYLGGHNAVMGGAIIGIASFVKAIRSTVALEGGAIDPGAAWRLWSGLQTLRLRVEEQNRRALRIAQRLERHPAIEQVWYPLLPSHPDYATAKRTIDGGGSVLSFSVRGGQERAHEVIDALSLWKIAASFGGITSLAQPTVLISYAQFTPEERARIGIREGLVRLSVGVIESADELLDDLLCALDQVAPAIHSEPRVAIASEQLPLTISA